MVETKGEGIWLEQRTLQPCNQVVCVYTYRFLESESPTVSKVFPLPEELSLITSTSSLISNIV